MLSTQNILNTLNEIKEISKLNLAVFYGNGNLMASTMEVEHEMESVIRDFVVSNAHQQTYESYRMFKIDVDRDAEYVLAITGDVENSIVIGQMAACQIRNLIISKTDDFDRNTFIQNVLLGNLLSIDIHTKAKKLHIEAKPRVVFVVDTGKKGTDVIIEFVKNLSDLKAGDFVTTVDEHSVVLVKDMSGVQEHELEEQLEDMMNQLSALYEQGKMDEAEKMSERIGVLSKKLNPAA